MTTGKGHTGSGLSTPEFPYCEGKEITILSFRVYPTTN
jgi:hypothetical protein